MNGRDIAEVDDDCCGGVGVESGAQLAQREARVVVSVLRDDFPDARLAGPFAELERDRSGMQSRRPATLPTWLRGT